MNRNVLLLFCLGVRVHKIVRGQIVSTEMSSYYSVWVEARVEVPRQKDERQKDERQKDERQKNDDKRTTRQNDDATKGRTTKGRHDKNIKQCRMQFKKV